MCCTVWGGVKQPVTLYQMSAHKEVTYVYNTLSSKMNKDPLSKGSVTKLHVFQTDKLHSNLSVVRRTTRK